MDLRRDYLSRLPDELIANILSRLTLKESGRTSVISRRWQNLWLFTNHCSGPHLTFKTPIYDDFLNTCESATHVDRKRLLYIGLLNEVFKFHQKQPLDELIISCFFLGSKYYTAIDKWIKYAFAKDVQRLELTISSHDSQFKIPYAFPSMHFRGSAVHRLRELCLRGLSINQPNLDALLSACPLLESLSLTLYKTGSLNVSSDKLKHLMFFCFQSSNRRFEISTPSLVSFCYKGFASSLHLQCIPSLSELYMWDRDPSPFFMKPNMHLSYVSRLKKLSLFLDHQLFAESHSYPMELPKLVKLEEFEVEVWGIDGDSFLWPTVFIKASPFLRKFCATVSASFCSARFHSEEEKRRINEGTKFTHQFLKVVEIREFSGWSSETELAQRLIHIGAQSLEKVIIDSRKPRYSNYGPEDRKKIAQSLGQGLESNVDLVVL